MKRLTILAAVCACLCLPVAGARAAPPQHSVAAPITQGGSYDRNASIVQDGATTWMFFARSELPCDRLAAIACNPDNGVGATYDLYSMTSTDGGLTWGAPTSVDSNPGPPGFRGRTVAAARRANGTIELFWADGGSGGALHRYTKAPGDPAFAPNTHPANAMSRTDYFNVEAVAKGNDVYLYGQDADGGIFEQTLPATAPATDPPFHVLPGTDALSIPKVIVGADGRFYMATVDGNAGDVYVSQSHDGEHWEEPNLVVAADGTVTNWDPSLAQSPDGRFYLFYAPDYGDGNQKIALRTSSDFVTWDSEPVLTNPSGYWDYWPEAIATATGLRLFYTSEAPATATATAGTGHIWSMSITRDGDDDGINDPQDCAPADGTRPNQGGADANCDGTIDPAAPQQQPQQQQQQPTSQAEPAPPDADRDGLPDVADCAPADAAKPARNGTDANCDGVVDVPAVVTLVLCSSGSKGADLLVCGNGKQTIAGLAGNDVISMGSGNDVVRAGTGDDLVLGQGGNDNLRGDAGDDSLDGGAGNDRLGGDAGKDSLVGGKGNDRIAGGSGEDVIRAGDGRDAINAADGKPGDVVSCGRGRDHATADRGDMVSKDCERVTRRR